MTKMKQYDDLLSHISIVHDGKTDKQTHVFKSREVDLQAPPRALKYLYTATVFGTFIAFGMCRGMYGPTLGELQLLTGADLNEISSVFTWIGAGGIIGSLTFGFLFDRFASLPTFVVTLILLGFFTIAIPWSFNLSMLMAICALQASFFTGIAVGCNVVTMRLWKKSAGSVVLGMHVLFTFGCFLAPIISEPFLTDVITEVTGDVTHNSVAHNNVDTSHADKSVGMATNVSTYEINDITHDFSIPLDKNNNSDQSGPAYQVDGAPHSMFSTGSSDLQLTNETYSPIVPLQSNIHYAYLIVGLYIELLAIIKLLLLIRYRHVRLPRVIDLLPHVKNVTKLTRYSSWGLFLMFNMFFGGVETIYMGLLFTFVSQHVGMTNAASSVLVAATFATHGAGRFVATMIVRFVSVQYIILFNLLSALLSSAALCYFNVSSVLAVWICTILIATGISSIFSATLVWAREFLHVTGRFTSTYVISYTVGMMTWPVLTAHLLQNNDGIWFPYMETILLSASTISFSMLFGIQKLCFHSKTEEEYMEQQTPSLKHRLAHVQEPGVFASLRSLHTI